MTQSGTRPHLGKSLPLSLELLLAGALAARPRSAGCAGACCPTTTLYVAVHHTPLVHCVPCVAMHAILRLFALSCSTSTSRPMAARLSAVARPQSQGILPQASGLHRLLPTDQRPQMLLPTCHWLRAWLPLCRMEGVCVVYVLHFRARPSGSHLANAAGVSHQGTMSTHLSLWHLWQYDHSLGVLLYK